MRSSCALTRLLLTTLTWMGAWAQVSSKDIYLILGQSNAAGRGELPTRLRVEPGVFVFNGDDFVPATENVNTFSTLEDSSRAGYSFGYNFGKQMTRGLEEEILLVSNAKGGTRISSWLPGAECYEAAVRRAREAMEVSGGKVAGVLWHQGEGNSRLSSYDRRLRQVIEGLREEFGDIPFVAGELSYARAAGSDNINSQLQGLVGVVDGYAVASANGLNAPDGTHFDANSMRMLGNRYGKAMLKLIRSNEAVDGSSNAESNVQTNVATNVVSNEPIDEESNEPACSALDASCQTTADCCEAEVQCHVRNGRKTCRPTCKAEGQFCRTTSDCCGSDLRCRYRASVGKKTCLFL